MYKFFAYLNRMKLINRWSLMRSTVSENIMEHSLMTAVIAHALATIENEIFKGSVDANSVAVKAMFHESAEVLTGDLPTPIKYFNPEIKQAYKGIEQVAKDKLICHLPTKLQASYTKILDDENSDEALFVKHADKLAAYIKCVEEACLLGNREFEKAKETLLQTIKSFKNRAVDFFVENFVQAFFLTLDELD